MKIDGQSQAEQRSNDLEREVAKIDAEIVELQTMNRQQELIGDELDKILTELA